MLRYQTFSQRLWIVGLGVLPLAMLWLGLSRLPVVYAATITVNSSDDVVADDGQCTLREAITAANTDTASGAMVGECAAGSGADVVALTAVTYTLSITGTNEDDNLTGDLDISSVITISGVSSTTTIIQAGSSGTNGIDRVLHVRSSGTLVLQNVMVRYGQATDPGPSPFFGWNGGGIYSTGVLTVSSSIIYSNTARFGGGIFASGPLDIHDSTVAANAAIDDGAGIRLGADSRIINTMVRENKAGDDGGGIFKSIASRLTIANTSLLENQAAGDGGGMFNGSSGGVNLIVRFLDNTVGGNMASRGAGLLNLGGTMDMQRSTFAANTALDGGGGLYNDVGTITILNSTFSGNTAVNTGGGLQNDAGIIDSLNNTFTDNVAKTGGGLFNVNHGPVSLTNTIIANSVGDDCAHPDGSAVINEDFNIVEDMSCQMPVGGDPMLGPLQDNGGATMTHALLEGSPAIDTGDCSDSTIFIDQRRVSRPQGSACDIGAYELVPDSFSIYLPIVVNGVTP